MIQIRRELCRFAVTISRDCWILSSLMEADGRHACLARPLLNFSVHSYTLLRDSAPLPYCVWSTRWNSSPWHEIGSLLCAPSLVHTQLAERQLLSCNRSKKTGTIKLKLWSRDQNTVNYKQAWVEGCVSNLMIWRKCKYFFLLTHVQFIMQIDIFLYFC